ncbi:hypothetical protein GW17_00018013 [Ensete ventricosum]|nr:hypothetical protein GW17_00018013 [Ensete ventricosum]
MLVTGRTGMGPIQLTYCVLYTIIHSAFLWQVHISASECLLEMSKLYRDTPTCMEDVELKEELVHLCEVEKSEQAKTLLTQCITILDDLKHKSSSTSGAV